VRAEAHRGGLEYRFYLDEPPSVEPSWALIAGEIMFDLRSALDHLVWELHVRRYRGRAIPQRIERASQFPIFDTYDDWRKKGLRRVKPLAKREQRAIRFLQPCERRNDQWSDVRRILGDLNTLHNIDKHRQLHLVASTQRFAMAPGFPRDVGFRFDPEFGPLKPDGHVDTWTFTEAPTEMQEHQGAYLDIVLEQPGYERDLIVLLDQLIEAVAAVLRRFAPRFPEPEAHLQVLRPAPRSGVETLDAINVPD
jgi:hypothetical protein